MTLAKNQKESSLGVRIYLYIIGLVCLSANVWFAYQLDTQQLRGTTQAPRITQDFTQEDNHTLAAVIPAETVNRNSHSPLN
ncbi:hypothetical protein [Thalassomonas actiniarum]|uniref:Uncharacterized protein n=1 Tax=Thalassomonas actiniarum TaxID=485447 RepID=A0AAE9YQN9_9GAMM|nr:hypothetical protein [Thalassomonas actiniarum]WDD97811.1 hypothetical protein SG35_021295 [Thalassomonas actiniarum]